MLTLFALMFLARRWELNAFIAPAANWSRCSVCRNCTSKVLLLSCWKRSTDTHHGLVWSVWILIKAYHKKKLPKTTYLLKGTLVPDVDFIMLLNKINVKLLLYLNLTGFTMSLS
jgi:hypothetical protein